MGKSVSWAHAIQGRTVLVLEDPGGEPLSQLIGTPMEMDNSCALRSVFLPQSGRCTAGAFIHKDL